MSPVEYTLILLFVLILCGGLLASGRNATKRADADYARMKAEIAAKTAEKDQT